MRITLPQRLLGKTGLAVSPLGFGAFKIGRNENIKYVTGYALPDEQAVSRLLQGVLDLGISYIDTAPAYGTSEELIGRTISHRRHEFTLSTKVGEVFEQGQSRYEFSADAVTASLERSLSRLRTEVLDLVFLHAHAADVEIQEQTDAVAALQAARQRGLVRAIGLSAKTPAGIQRSLDWADVVMVEYHLQDRTCETALAEAAGRGLGVVIKKGLSSGKLPPGEAIPFLLDHPAVSSLVIGGLNLDHLRTNLQIAAAGRTDLDRSPGS